MAPSSVRWTYHWTFLFAVVCLCSLVAGTDKHGNYFPRESRAAIKVVFVSVALSEHLRPLLSLALEMKARGYQVSVLSYSAAEKQVVDMGITFISMGEFPFHDDYVNHLVSYVAKEGDSFNGMLAMHNDLFIPTTTTTYEKALANLESNRPHMMVVDSSTLGAMEVAEKLRVPFVINTPSLLFQIKNNHHLIPSWGSGFRSNMTTIDRCLNVLVPRFLEFSMTPSFMQLNRFRWDIGLQPYATQGDMYRGVQVIHNSILGVEYPQPVSPLHKYVGPMFPPQGNIPTTPAALDQWIATMVNSSRSIILVNFGEFSWLDRWHVDRLVQGMDDVDLAVLWILPRAQLEETPVLQHPPSSFRVFSEEAVDRLIGVMDARISAHVSHCGASQAEEALAYGKPVLCIPFSADQMNVAIRVEEAGAGIILDKRAFSVDEVNQKIESLVKTDAYKAPARTLASLMRVAGGRVEGANILETTMLVGTRHLQGLDTQLAWYKMLFIDVHILILAFVSILSVVSWMLFNSAVSWVRAMVAQARSTVAAKSTQPLTKNPQPNDDKSIAESDAPMDEPPIGVVQ